MSDILNISSSTTEFEVDEAGDRGINHLKNTARKHKGRGISEEHSRDSRGSRDSRDARDDISQKSIESSENEYRYFTWGSLNKKKNDDEINTIHFYDDKVAQKSIEGWVLFVTGIHEEANEDEISDKFSEIAKIKTIRTNLDRRTGFMKNYAVIEYASYEDAYKTKEALNGTDLLGLKVDINWCFVKGPSIILRNKN